MVKQRYPIEISARDAKKMLGWIRTRGGVAVWESVDLSNLGRGYTPALDDKGNAYPKPHWRYANEPDYIETDPGRVVVKYYKVVRRFHVATRLGSQGFKIKLTEASSDKVYKALEKAGAGACYDFDYASYENCVIMAPERTSTLADWAKENEEKEADHVEST